MAQSNSIQNETITWQADTCYLGTVLVARTTEGICSVLLGDSTEELVADLAKRFPGSVLLHTSNSRDEWFISVMNHLVDSRKAFPVPLDMRGTEFQRRVWQALQSIPSGSCASYGDVARKVGIPSGSRAVAGACAANPLAVLVPCHRVLKGDGGLSGYRWGIRRKQALLDHEQSLSER
jgi:AraC family transcriptional regulator of adaptative response/methylated-DNA-[protein]-cysteine methyltransferase